MSDNSDCGCDQALALKARVAELEAQLASVEEYAWDWYLAGFEESGEGWNGEYPLNHPGKDVDAILKQLRESFAEAYVEQRAHHKEDGR